MSGHTPGPWTFLEGGRTEEDGNAGHPLTICGPDGDDLANVYSRDDATVNISREEAIANARLMTAGPAMLEALETTRLNIVSLRAAGLPGPLTEWLRVVDEAIAKATTP